MAGAGAARSGSGAGGARVAGSGVRRGVAKGREVRVCEETGEGVRGRARGAGPEGAGLAVAWAEPEVVEGGVSGAGLAGVGGAGLGWLGAGPPHPAPAARRSWR